MDVSPPGEWKMQQRRQEGGARVTRRDMEPYHDIVSCVFEHNVDQMERILRNAALVRHVL